MSEKPKFNKHTKRHNRIAVSVFFFLAGLTFASWASRIPDIKDKLQLSSSELGSVLFALPVGLMLSLVMAGALITRLGSRLVMIFASLCYGLNLVCLGMANSVPVLVTALFTMGIFGNLFNVSVNAQAVGVELKYKRSIMASFHGIWSLAGFAGAALGTVMIKLNLLPQQHFVLVCCLAIATALLFAKYTIADEANSNPSPVFVLPDKSIWQYGIIAFCCLVCEGTMFDWSGVYYQQAVHATPATVTVGYSAFMGCMALGRFMADKLIMKWGSLPMLRAAGIIIATGLLLAVLIPTLPVATVGFMLVGLGVSSVVPIVYSLSGKSKTMNPGQAIAAVSTVGFTGFLLGPPLIGYVADATSIRASFAIAAVIGLFTTILSLRLPSKQR